MMQYFYFSHFIDEEIYLKRLIAQDILAKAGGTRLNQGLCDSKSGTFYWINTKENKR